MKNDNTIIRWIEAGLGVLGFASLFLNWKYINRFRPWPIDFRLGEFLILLAFACGLIVTGTALFTSSSSRRFTVFLPVGILLLVLSLAWPGFLESPQSSRNYQALHNLRVASQRVHEYLEQNGKLPSSSWIGEKTSDLIDPYSYPDEENLWSVELETGGFVLLYKGPDGDNDVLETNQFIQYSPTNGAFSDGDLFELVPIEE